MSSNRLSQAPNHTVDVLREVTSGASTTEELANRLGCEHGTAMNKAHDPVILGLVDRDDSQLSVADDARRVVQLQDIAPLKTKFLELTGVSKILDRIEKEPMSVEDIGRVISYETGSNASAESTFKTYGRVYGKWIDYLDLGNCSQGFVAIEEIEKSREDLGPLENPLGASYPRVPPEKVFHILPKISKEKSHKKLAKQSGYSAKELSKTLSTCYGLGLAESTRNGPVLTERGRDVQQASAGNRKRILQDALIQVPLVQAYCDRAPDKEFKNIDVMSQISEDYVKGWSEATIQTRAKRLYSWFLFTDLFEETNPGNLKPKTIAETSESVAK